MATAGKGKDAVLAVSGLGLIMLAGAALLRFPLLDSYKVQILTLESQVRADPGLGPALVLAIVLAFGCYVAGWAALGRSSMLTGGLRTALVVGPPLVCALLLLFVHPTSSLDLYDYLYRGHMAARYDANNFIQTPNDLRALDRLYWYTAWRSATTAYGPFWELLSIGVARLAGPDLLGLVLGFKVAALASWLLVAGAILLAARPGERLAGLFLWLWNPLVLWELPGAGHNDGWMLACLICALACLRRRPVLALFLVTAGALLKYPAALLWPVLLAAALVQARQNRLALVVQAGFGSAALVIAAYLPWWVGPKMLEQIWSRRELFSGAPLALFEAAAREWMPREELLDLISRLVLIFLALGLVGATWLAARRPDAVALIGAGLLIWFVTVATPWFQPWYLIWPIGLLVLRPNAGAALGAVGAMSLGAWLSYPAFAALRPLLNWPVNEAPWRALIVGLIYGPPLVLLAFVWRRRARTGEARALQQQEAT